MNIKNQNLRMMKEDFLSEANFSGLLWKYIKILKNAGRVVGYSCAIVQMTGNGNPCAYLTDQVIQGLINSQQAKIWSKSIYL